MANPAGGRGPSIPLVKEELEVQRREVETGRVRVHTVVSEREEAIDELLCSQDAELERVPVDRLLEAPAEPHCEGEWFVIPVLEEVMVKRWRLKEEVRIRRRTAQRPYRERHVLRSEQAVIEKQPPTPKESSDG